MPVEFGDVVLVPFPFTDQTASKKRPAVATAYGWPADISEEDALARLLALNLDRAAGR
jgi:hypothetical protein